MTSESSGSELGAPPVARVARITATHHGETLADDYAWMRDPNYPTVETPEILAHLEAENAYFARWLAPRQALARTLEAEFRGRVKEDDQATPWRDGGYEYRWRFDAGAQYRVWDRRPAGGGGAWSTFLDEPALAARSAFFQLGGLAVSPDGTRLAYTVDLDGSERFTLRLVDVATGAALGPETPDTIGAPVWTAGGEAVLYLELSPEWRPHKLKLLEAGQPPDQATTLYEETDPGFFMGLSLSQSRAYIILSCGDSQTSEARLWRRDAGVEALRGTAPTLVAAREPGHEYDIDHGGGRFFIRTNDRHKNFRLAWAPEETPRRAHWRDLIDGSDRVYIRGHYAFAERLALQERVDGLDQIRLREHDDGSEHRVAFPEAAYAASLGINAEPTAPVLRLSYQSMATPATVYDYHVAERRLETRKVQEIPSGYDAGRYEMLRLTAPLRDGAQAPVSLLRLKAPPPDQEAPRLHLTAYGSYGYGSPPNFSPYRLSLVDRGVAVAIAHVRGGDELGYAWYEAGKLDQRENTFRDVIDVARHLQSEGFAAPGRITAQGGSAGGTVMGAALNMAPELWAGVVAAVPFVDVLNTMLDASLPLTPIEWKEWGDPVADADAFRRIAGYCPYQNVAPAAYPPVLATAGLSDPRVGYWEPAKWAAKLRAATTSDAPVLLKTNLGAGHAGKSGRFDRLKEIAEEFAFVLWALGDADAATPNAARDRAPAKNAAGDPTP